MSKGKVGGRKTENDEVTRSCVDCGRVALNEQEIHTIMRCSPTGRRKFVKVCKGGCKNE